MDTQKALQPDRHLLRQGIKKAPSGLEGAILFAIGFDMTDIHAIIEEFIKIILIWNPIKEIFTGKFKTLFPTFFIAMIIAIIIVFIRDIIFAVGLWRSII